MGGIIDRNDEWLHHDPELICLSGLKLENPELRFLNSSQTTSPSSV